MKNVMAFFLSAMLLFSLSACGQQPQLESDSAEPEVSFAVQTDSLIQTLPEGFVLIEGGTFEMGSPEDEAWRGADEPQHTITISDFYMSCLLYTSRCV